MAVAEDKENVAPTTSSDPLQHKASSPSPKKASKKGRSKSIGPGFLNEPEAPKQDKQDAKNRRKSTYVPATKSILSSEQEKKERQAARRKTLANRRVSFAPEATLHTWDVIEFMRDPTTSTDSPGSTRRASNFTRSSNGGSPFRRSQQNLDSDPPSTPPEQADEGEQLPSSPAPQRDLHQKQRRRASGVPAVNPDSPEDALSSSGISTSDASDSEGEDDAGEDDASGSDDDTGTAMSIDVDESTSHSVAASDSSTGSSARLEAALRQAAHQAGTRGIDYDEYGEESMELATEEVTNAFKPWVQQSETNQAMGPAATDQENVNPFSPAFKAQLISGYVRRPSTVAEEDTGDLSMDETRAVGGIVNAAPRESPSSQFGDGTMDFTQAVGKIQETAQNDSPKTRSGQKRRRSTTEAGSPAVGPTAQTKRRRSSVARSSMGDDTMDLTVAVGGIQNNRSPAKSERRKSVAKRRSSGAVSEQDEATMEFTQVVGGIKAAAKTENTASSWDENEELTMELTTVLGGIKEDEEAVDEVVPQTPQQSQSPIRNAVNTTPKDQARFKDAPDSGPKKLLTPMFEKQILHSAEKKDSGAKGRKSMSPAALSRPSVAFAELPTENTEEQQRPDVTDSKTMPNKSPAKVLESPVKLPSLGDHKPPLRATPTQSPARRRGSATPDSALPQQLDQQLQAPEPSPTVQKQQRSSPAKPPTTPDKQVGEGTQDGRRLAESIKLMSTPRKETLKSVTPRKQAPAAQQQASPQRSATPRGRPRPKAKPANVSTSPAKQLSDDLDKIQQSDKPVERIQLQKFLDVAGIRFMDLTATKRRMTTATTPSKARKAGDIQNEAEVNLESAVVAGSCTLPELEMYEHACHELKRYISDGKRVIKELEVETAKETPPLIQAYTAAGPNRKAVLDTQMRDIKTHARYRSKEMWYAWRSQLLEDLMKALQGMGEGLLRDDEVLQRAETILEQVMPGLVEQHEVLRHEAEQLEQEANATSEEEREELDQARERLQIIDDEIAEKQRMLEELQSEVQQQETLANDLEENREEFVGAIQEAERVKESCRSVSTKEIAALKESVHALEQTYGWSVSSSASSPEPTITMAYKSQLQLFFHPLAFNNANGKSTTAPISLTYTGSQQPLNTTLRFFLQLLRASLHALPQSSTQVPDLLNLVSNGWDTALAVAESERRLHLEGMTDTRIVSDERLCISSTILLPKIRTKVRVDFSIAVSAEDEGMELSTTVEASAKVVYGEVSGVNEKKMSEFVQKGIDGLEGWAGAVREVRERLMAKVSKK